MKKIIASIKLAPGNRGYFDPLTGINLTISNSIGYIREDDDISNIRKAIREGKIKIVGGQLPPAINNIKPVKEAKKEKPVKIKEEKIEIIIPVAENKKQLKTTTAIKKKEELRYLYGFKAKNKGKEILKETNNGENSRFEPDFEHKILKAVWYKFRRNANLLTPEYKRLPIVHYYCYGGKIIDVTSKYQWLIDGITKMRDYL